MKTLPSRVSLNTPMNQIVQIDDARDKRVKDFANVKRPRSEAVGDPFVVEGRWCVQRLVESNYEVDSVLVQHGREAEFAALVDDGVVIYSLPSDQIQELVGYPFHRGVLATGRRKPWLPWSKLCEFQAEKKSPLLLAVLGVAQHDNLGSIIRSAAALGVQQILIGPGTVDPLSRRVIRVSMATVFSQQLYRLDDPIEQLTQLQERSGLRTVATTLDKDALPLEDFSHDHRDCLLIFGSEAEGIDQSVQRIVTDRLTIPMQSGTDSLNVSVAAAIFMYALSRPQSRR